MTRHARLGPDCPRPLSGSTAELGTADTLAEGKAVAARDLDDEAAQAPGVVGQRRDHRGAAALAVAIEVIDAGHADVGGGRLVHGREGIWGAMNSTVDWKPIGQVNVIGGSLVFPRASTAQGIYWFSVSDGPDVIAGYVGQTGRKNGLAGRFGNYRNRGNHPAYDKHGNLGTTSRNAQKLISAIKAGRIVDVSVLDDASLAGKINAWRNELEKTLIGELCASGVEVWNLAHVEGRWKMCPCRR